LVSVADLDALGSPTEASDGCEPSKVIGKTTYLSIASPMLKASRCLCLFM